MSRVISFSKLIRLPNLLIIALAQYAMRWGVIYPMFTYVNRELIANYPDKITNKSIVYCQVGDIDFFLLCLSTVMIAAAGYIINDYFDVNIDRINKPNQLIIDNGIKRREAMKAHFIISTLAILLAGYVSHRLGLWHYGFIFLACAIGLWFYTTDFKKQFLTGNLVIAAFVALVPFIVGLYELQLCSEKYKILMAPPFSVNFKVIFNFILGFSVLAFILNLIREIIKDAEDMEGDKAYGCRTLPVVLGIDSTKNVIVSLSVILLLVIGYIQKGQYDAHAWISLLYLLLLVEIPMLVVVYLVLKAKVASDFKVADLLSKIVMLTGIGYTGIIYLSFI